MLAQVFDGVTKGVAALSGVVAGYAFLTKNAHEIVPAVVSVWGLSYAVLLGLSGLILLCLELFYWHGPAHRRPSFFYRLALVRKPGAKFPTNWEILAAVRRRDQVLTLLVGLGGTAFMLLGSYFLIVEDLRAGFPVDRWSGIWVLGCLALAVTLVFAALLLWSWWKGDRVPHRKRRCDCCGELCPSQARRCLHCAEWSPAWRLLSPRVLPVANSAPESAEP